MKKVGCHAVSIDYIGEKSIEEDRMKKLSKDGLVMNLDKMIEDYKNEVGWCEVWEKTVGQIKSLIESSAKEPSNRKIKKITYLPHVDAPFVEYEESQEPSGAELEEFVEKWVKEWHFYTDWKEGLSEDECEENILKMLKEYDELRRG